MTEQDDSYLTARDVRQRYGNRSDSWLWRMLEKKESGFPQPVKLGGGRFRYWRLSELIAWERACATSGSAVAA